VKAWCAERLSAYKQPSVVTVAGAAARGAPPAAADAGR
jgi:hypothetical protein